MRERQERTRAAAAQRTEKLGSFNAHPPQEPPILADKMPLGQFEISAFTLGSALVFWPWHLCDLVSRLLFYRNSRHHGSDLISCLAMTLLQEIPERIDKNVIGGRSLVLPDTADIADPAYGCPFFGSQTNSGPQSIIRDVFLSRAHDSDCS
jgi:hypothetical protein